MQCSLETQEREHRQDDRSFPSNRSMVGKGHVSIPAHPCQELRSFRGEGGAVETRLQQGARTAHKTCWLSINTFIRTWSIRSGFLIVHPILILTTKDPTHLQDSPSNRRGETETQRNDPICTNRNDPVPITNQPTKNPQRTSPPACLQASYAL